MNSIAESWQFLALNGPRKKKYMDMFMHTTYLLFSPSIPFFFTSLTLLLPFLTLIIINWGTTAFLQQAQFKNLSAILMASFFAITTPAGIAAGAGLTTFYNPNSPRALVVEGILDSVSAGILIYMSLVDLIAADFLGGKMTGSLRQQVVAYIALFLGALSMSSLAIWAWDLPLIIYQRRWSMCTVLMCM